jgi:hypothetical protein
MVIVNVRDRKFIVRFEYGPAGVSKYSLKKAIKLLEKDSLHGVLALSHVKEILSKVKTTVKPIDAPERFSRRKTVCSIEEEFIIDGKRELHLICEVSAANWYQDAFTKDYGRTYAFKKAVLKAIANSENKLETEDVNEFEQAWKTQVPKSANTWDAIDSDCIVKVLAEEAVA